MGFRFRRTISISPGVRLNISKSGVSTSFGVRGAHITVGHGKLRHTVGIPGTGVSYTTVSGQGRHSDGGFVFHLLLLIKYFPLVASYGSFIYGCYALVKGWHPLLVSLALACFTWIFVTSMRELAGLISQLTAAMIGGLLYAAIMIVWKVRSMPELDWPWACFWTTLFGVIGAWSYASCHAAIMQVPGQMSPATPKLKDTLPESVELGNNNGPLPQKLPGPEALSCVETSVVASEFALPESIEGISGEGSASIETRRRSAKQLQRFQHMVADRLRSAGWSAEVIPQAQADGMVSAEFREKRILILCNPSFTAVSSEAVYILYDDFMKEQADFAAIVSNYAYSQSELWLSLGTRIRLLRLEELDTLQELLFGFSASDPHYPAD